MRKAILVFLLGLTSCSAMAWETPEKAISEFLKFELDGGRLSSDGWQDYTSKYIYAPEDYDEPGWDAVTVVVSYAISSINCSGTSNCEAEVIFDLFPTSNLPNAQVVQHAHGGKEVIRYPLVCKDKSWRLEPSLGIPIVTPTTLAKF
jgi:hypothetical protein